MGAHSTPQQSSKTSQSNGKFTTESHHQDTPSQNSMAERFVQTIKSSLTKTMEGGEDIDLALLTYKTTPLSHNLPSPAELLNSRKYKTLLPTHIVPTRLQAEYKQIMGHGKQMQANLYNQHARVLQRLRPYQKVVVQLDPDKNIWAPAKIIQCPTEESRLYSLKTIHGGVYTRNRRFIKPDLTAGEGTTRQADMPKMTRPTRTIRKPDRLIESESS